MHPRAQRVFQDADNPILGPAIYRSAQLPIGADDQLTVRDDAGLDGRRSAFVN